MTWKNSVCMTLGRVHCPDMNKMVEEKDTVEISPIDYFYNATAEILKIPPDFFTTYSKDFAGLFYVGLISATENYFRDILGYILTECPLSQAHSADERVQLGSLLWSPKDLHSRSAFEFMAFSSGKNIKDTIHKFLNYQLKNTGVAYSMVMEYDKLCELRHAIVHSGNIVAGKNAVKLDLKRSKKILRVDITYSSLQTAGEICTSLVQSANNELFEMMIERWAESWRKQSSWDNSKEDKLLQNVRKAFLSSRDKKRKTIQSFKHTKELKKEIYNSFNI